MPKAFIPEPFNLKLTDPYSKEWLFKLTGQPSVSWLNQDSFSIVLNAEGRKIGDFDEQRSWDGGRGGERFSEDPTRYKDAREAATWIPGHLFPSLQWQISSGYRDAETSLVGSKSFRGLFGTTQSISITIQASATSNRRKAWLWIKRVGSPGTLTVELRDNSGGSPGSVLKTVDITTSTVTDYFSVLQEMDFGSNQAVTSGTTYHIVACGADTDNEKNHWEVAVDTSGSSSKYSASGAADAGTWTSASFSMYYRLTDPEIDRRWWFQEYSGNLYAVSNEATTKLYKWNESTDLWEEVTGHGLTTVTGRPIVANGFMYFPCGDSTAIRSYNGTNWDAQTVATGQGCAYGLALGYSVADNKAQIWRYNRTLVSGGTTTGLANSVSRADIVAAYTTDLAFRNSIPIGDPTTNITGIDVANNTLWVRKTNEIGTVDNDRYTELNYGIKKTPSADNGIAWIAWNQLIYFNWLFSFERVLSGTVDDVGQGFKNNSLPYGREGVVSAFTSYIAHLFYVIDAGASGTSSVMIYDGLNHHEFARGWYAGRRIRDVFIQPVSGGRNRLWFDCGGDLVFTELPYNKGNPLDDSAVKYMHEFVLESSEIDMGTASKLPKFIKDLTLTSKNLNKNGIRVEIDWKFDDETTWRVQKVERFLESPEDTVNIRRGNIRKFQYRLRGMTDNQLIPPDIRGIVPNGFARSPQLRILECEAQIKDFTSPKKQTAAETLRWMEDAAAGSYLIKVASKYDQFDGYEGVIAPPNIFPIRAIPEKDAVTFTILVM